MMLEPAHTESMFGTGIEKSPAASNGIVSVEHMKQWNLSNPDTSVTEESVLISEVC